MREQIQSLLDGGHDYESAARELGISPGLAFMVATGLPADGSGAPAPEELESASVPPGGSQRLVGPPAHNPTRDEGVISWVKQRARRELTSPR